MLIEFLLVKLQTLHSESHLSSSDYEQLRASQSILRNCRMNGNVATYPEVILSKTHDLMQICETHRKATRRKRHPQPRADFPCECVSAMVRKSTVLTAQETQDTGNLAQSAAYRTSSWPLLLPHMDVRMGYTKPKMADKACCVWVRTIPQPAGLDFQQRVLRISLLHRAYFTYRLLI
jgi:hypothetical protein